jgi:hypothetical protein
MKSLLIPTACTILAAGTSAQTTSKSEPTATPGVERQSISDEERNTRAYIELLRKDIRSSKSQLIGQVMSLDADESRQFWPIYKDFETEMAKVGDQILVVVRRYVENYDNMTDALANELAIKLLSVEQQRNTLKRKYYDRVNKRMGAITAMRFLQVENQLERLMDLQIASQLPVDAR